MILNTYSIKEEKETKAKNQQSTNIFLLGNDFSGLNDFNMIVTINQKKKRILLTTITRDFRIPVHGYEGQEDNLEYMAPLGIDTSIASLEDFFEIDIDYYVRINVDSVVKVVDTIGGITYCSDFDYWSNTSNAHNKNGKSFHVIKGCQEVDGYKALAIARERKKIPGSDIARQNNIRKILLAIFDKIKTTDSLKNYAELLDALSDTYETTIPRSYMNQMAKELLSENSKWTIEENFVYGDEIIGMVHLGTVRDYTMIPNPESVQDAKDKIKNIGRK
jgi:LCP family protein required for cell wall assembly